MIKFDITVIGASWGGLQAMETILGSLPKNLAIAIAVAQHRHKDSEGELLSCLQRYSLLPVVEVIDKQAIAPGQVYLAPADYHLLVEPGHFALSTEAPVSYARPSIDVLFESTADAYKERAIGVILTGSNQDGAQGLAKVKAHDGLAIVQDPTTAVSRIMPDAAIAAVVSARILPLTEIAPFLVKLCSSSFLSSSG